MPVDRPFEFFIQWHLTERCNLKCLHCYQQGSPVDELSLDQIMAVAAEVAETVDAWAQSYRMHFALSYNITGGEPFLRPDLFEILEAVVRQKSEVFVLTNGTLITRETAHRLADSGVKGVQVSLEGPQEIHDRVRGDGSFTKALNGVQHLVAARLPVTLNTTLSRLNAAHIRTLTEIARDAGASRLGFTRLVPAGRGGELVADMLDPASLKDLYCELLSLQMDELEIVIGDPLAARIKEETSVNVDKSDLAIAGCAVAVSGLTFLSDGTIVPCRRLPIPIGNVLHDSLRETWASSPVLRQFRDRNAYAGECGKCRMWAFCRGCRAIAYACSEDHENGHLDDDPQCFLNCKKSKAAECEEVAPFSLLDTRCPHALH